MQNGGREAQGKVQMLYIQMEFCPRTLKQVLAQGVIDPADAWQVTSQLTVCQLGGFSWLADLQVNLI